MATYGAMWEYVATRRTTFAYFSVVRNSAISHHPGVTLATFPALAGH